MNRSASTMRGVFAQMAVECPGQVSESVIKPIAHAPTRAHHAAPHRVLLHERRGFICQLLLVLNVVTDVTELLFHHPHRLKVRGRIKTIPPKQQQLSGNPEHGVRADGQTTG